MDNPGFDLGREDLVRRQQTLFNEFRHRDEERKFLNMIKDGDIISMKTLLQEHPCLNVNCCDIRGRRALEIAIQNRDSRIILELLSLSQIDIDHVYAAVLLGIKENQLMDVNLLLESPQALRAATERPDEYPNIVVNNMTPIMMAAVEQRLEITKLLLDRGHFVDQPYVLEGKPDESCKKEKYIKKREELSEFQLTRNAFRALASPTYIILTSDDPVLTAFELCQELKKISRTMPEFQEEFNHLANQCSEFAAAILNQCKTTSEVQTVLMQTRGFPESRPFRFPRLYLAILFNQKDFVAHPNCQQVLKSLWIEGLPNWPKWDMLCKSLYIALQIFLTPILGFLYLIFPNPQLLKNLRVPMNRFVYNATSYVIFIILILISIFYGRRDFLKLKALWSEVLVGIWVIGYVWDIVLNIWALGLKIYMRSVWAVYDLIMFTLFFIAELCWLAVFLSTKTVDEYLDRDRWVWYHPYLIGEAVFAVATVMAICRFLQWCQLNRSIGPLGISLTYMVGDVARFLLIVLIVFFGFSAGLNSIYRNYAGNVLTVRDNLGQVKKVTQDPHFTTIGRSLRALFWSIYTMGSPDYADLVVAGNVSAYGPITEPVKHYFTEAIGKGLWSSYHVLTLIILLNMLVAMMTNSFERIKFYSAPFNLFPTFYCLRVFSQVVMALFKWDIKEARKHCSAERSCFQEYEQERNRQMMQQQTYRTLIVQLVRRYLQSQELIEREWINASRSSQILSSVMSDVFQSPMEVTTASGVKLRNPPSRRQIQHYLSNALFTSVGSENNNSTSPLSTPL